MALQDELDILISDFKKNQTIVLTSKDSHYKQIKIYFNNVLFLSAKAFKNASKYGISGKTNQSLLKNSSTITTHFRNFRTSSH